MLGELTLHIPVTKQHLHVTIISVDAQVNGS